VIVGLAVSVDGLKDGFDEGTLDGFDEGASEGRIFFTTIVSGGSKLELVIVTSGLETRIPSSKVSVMSPLSTAALMRLAVSLVSLVTASRLLPPVMVIFISAS